MRILTGADQFEPPDAGVVLTIGNFDGVHLGHQRLLARAREVAGEAGAGGVVAMSFEPHPIAVLRPGHEPPCLSTPQGRAALLCAAGADSVIFLQTTRELLGKSATEFLTDCVLPCRPRALIEGPTFQFGRGRAGNNDTLRDFGATHGFSTEIVPELYAEQLAGRPAINSSAIREALSDGQVEVAATMLGRCYEIAGVVGHGDGRGAPLGFPTANLEAVKTMLPAHAVYAAIATLRDGSRRPAAVNVGPQPTFDQMTARVEAHILDFEGGLRGERLALAFVQRLRGQSKFDGVEHLIAQLGRDVETTRGVTARFFD
ncbi:MAG: riboflavin biosynthesis protein RibF [Phycisphaerales bacterium]|nr:riboflavin biosynthesis protein RibF [Phycisphaerales bacterium]